MYILYLYGRINVDYRITMRTGYVMKIYITYTGTLTLILFTLLQLMKKF